MFHFNGFLLVLYQKFYWTATNYVSFMVVLIRQARGRKAFLFGYLLIFQMLGDSPALHLNVQDDGGAAVSLLLNCFLAPTLQGLWVIHNPRCDVIAFGCRAPPGESWRLYRIPIWGGTREPKGFITFTSRAYRGLWCVLFFHKQMPDLFGGRRGG